MSDADVEKPLTHRERISLQILMVMFAVTKPFGWSHEIQNEVKNLKAALNIIKQGEK